MNKSRETTSATISKEADHHARDMETVRIFLEASMVPDPDTAMTYMAPDVSITFSGGRKFNHPKESAALNKHRYKWVKKRMERFDVVPGADETIVYSIGTLYGQWPNGDAFEENRYVDRFVVRDGKIVKMDVWNDSAERLLQQFDLDA